jgi:hypothetical protein
MPHHRHHKGLHHVPALMTILCQARHGRAGFVALLTATPRIYSESRRWMRRSRFCDWLQVSAWLPQPVSGALGPAVRYRSRPRHLGATLNSELHAWGALVRGAPSQVRSEMFAMRHAFPGRLYNMLARLARCPTHRQPYRLASPSSFLASCPSTSRRRPLGAYWGGVAPY